VSCERLDNEEHGTRYIQVVCMTVVASSSVASTKFLRAKYMAFREQQYFVWDTPCQTTKWQDMLENCRAKAPLPPWLPLWWQAKN